MRNTSKKIISLIAAAALSVSAFSLAGCGDAFKLKDKLELPTGEVTSNGGFVVEKGDYVYFINGQASYDMSNAFGDAQKGALMRIKQTELKQGKYDEAEMVVPMLFVNANYDSGIYIYDDYVYFATPSTDKDLDGNLKNSELEFRRAKLDGSDTKATPFATVTSNSAQYRFVEIDETVYCLYVDGTALKSCNTATGDVTTLASNAGAFVFNDDAQEKASEEFGTVYYTMTVPKLEGTDAATTEEYNQIYRVRADATATTDKNAASYTVTGNGYTKTYDFDENFLKEKNNEAKEEGNDAPYDLADYTTYPYVNLGELVVDGIGSSSEIKLNEKYNVKADAEAAKTAGKWTELKGYTYTLQSYENGGIYFTRTKVMAGSNEIAALYYLADETTQAQGWNTVSGNSEFDVVSLNTTNASASAKYLYDAQTKQHSYLYVSGDSLYRADQPTVAQDGSYKETEPLELETGVTGAILLSLQDNYLYYYNSTNNLFRIDYTGDEENYHAYLEGQEEFDAVQILKIEWNTSWYAPEFVGNVLLYNNMETVADVTNNYIYALNLGVEETKDDVTVERMMNVKELKAFNEQYQEIFDFIQATADTELKAAMTYYFRTGETKLYNDVVDLYETFEKNEFTAFITHTASENKTGADYTKKFKDDAGKFYDVQSYFFGVLGQVSDEDEEAYEEAWVKSLRGESEDEEAATEEFPGWAVALIVIGSVLLVGALGVVIFINVRKASKKAMEEQMRTSKKRKKIDTTDDKTIDVYADDEPTAEPETPAEEPVEETAEPVEETAETAEPVEETAETAAEEPVAEAEQAPAAAEETPAEEAPAADETEKTE